MRDSKESFKKDKRDNKKKAPIPMPLPLRLKKNGYEYEKYLETSNGFIYSQWHSNNFVGYEVFLKKISREKNIKGRIISPKVRFPNDEAFGYWAWTVKTLDRAITKFVEITGLNSKEVELLIKKQNG